MSKLSKKISHIIITQLQLTLQSIEWEKTYFLQIFVLKIFENNRDYENKGRKKRPFPQPPNEF